MKQRPQAKLDPERVVKQVKSKWGVLTEEDIMAIKNDINELPGRVQLRYGLDDYQAGMAVDDFLKEIMDREDNHVDFSTPRAYE